MISELNDTLLFLNEDAEAYLKMMQNIGSAPESKLFFQWMLDNCKHVDVVDSSTLDIADDVAKFMKRQRIQVKECYRTAVMAAMNLPYVEFVSGYADFSGMAIKHAWNCYKGKYFDLQREAVLNSGFDKYTQICKINVSDMMKYLKQNKDVPDGFFYYDYVNKMKIPKERYQQTLSYT